jgi:CheY-like chemotaxis protein
MESLMTSLKRLLVVEDQPQEMKLAASAAQSIGIADVEGRTSIRGAREYLDSGLRGETELPDGIVLDLDLGYESGYELLRYWHSTPRLAAIPLIVWSILGEQREMCRLFKVTGFVGKWEGEEAFRDALSSLTQSSPDQL